MRFLSLDSPFTRVVTTAMKLLLLNFYIVVASLPVITIGPAVIAALSLMLEFVESKECPQVTVRFWKRLCANWKHGFALSGILMGAAYLVWMNAQIASAYTAIGAWGTISNCVIALLVLLHLLYAFPLEARYENKLLVTLKNARNLFLAFPLRGIIICLAMVGEVLLFWYTSDFFFSLAMFIAPITILWTVSILVLPVFRKVEEEKVNEQEVV